MLQLQFGQHGEPSTIAPVNHMQWASCLAGKTVLWTKRTEAGAGGQGAAHISPSLKWGQSSLPTARVPQAWCCRPFTWQCLCCCPVTVLRTVHRSRAQFCFALRPECYVARRWQVHQVSGRAGDTEEATLERGREGRKLPQ